MEYINPHTLNLFTRNNNSTEYSKEANKTLFVGNLPFTVTAEKLRRLFEAHGEIVKIDLINANKSNPNNAVPVAFIEFIDIASVIRAINAVRGQRLDGNHLLLYFAKPLHPTHCVWIGNIKSISESDLRLFLSNSRVRNILKCVMNLSKERALIYFDRPAYAQCAIRKVHGAAIGPQRVVADFASRAFLRSFYRDYKCTPRRNFQRPASRSNVQQVTHWTPAPPTNVNQRLPQMRNINGIRSELRRQQSHATGSSAQGVSFAPPQGHGTPPVSRAPPQGHGTPPVSRAPPQGHGTPPVSRAPPQGYGTPPVSRAPLQGHGTPPVSRAPPQGHGTPPVSRAPPQGYGTPPVSRAPPQGHGTPPVSRAPPRGHGTPPVSRAPPQGYGTPPVSRAPPRGHGTPPVSRAPPQGHGTPPVSRAPPQGHGTPPVSRAPPQGHGTPPVSRAPPQGHGTPLVFRAPEEQNIATTSQERLISGPVDDYVITFNDDDESTNEEVNNRLRRGITTSTNPAEEYQRGASRVLFIKNLDCSADFNQLYLIFQRFGQIINISIKIMRGIRVHAFVEYIDVKSVVNAINTVSGKTVQGLYFDLKFGTIRKSSVMWISGIPETITRSDLLLNINNRINLEETISRCIIDQTRRRALVYFRQVNDAVHAINHFHGSSLFNCKLVAGFSTQKFEEKFNADLYNLNINTPFCSNNPNGISDDCKFVVHANGPDGVQNVLFEIPTIQRMRIFTQETVARPENHNHSRVQERRENHNHSRVQERRENHNHSRVQEPDHIIDLSINWDERRVDDSTSTTNVSTSSYRLSSSNQDLALSNIKDENSLVYDADDSTDYSYKYTHKLKRASRLLNRPVHRGEVIEKQVIEKVVNRPNYFNGYSLSLKPTNILIASNIRREISLESLIAMFRCFGNILKMCVSTTDSELYSYYVHYESILSVQAGINKLNGYMILGFFMKLDYGEFKDFEETRLAMTECDSNQEPSDIALLDKPLPIKTEPIPSADLNSSTDNSSSSTTNNNCNHDLLDQMDSTQTVIRHTAHCNNSQEYDPNTYAITNDGRLHTVDPLLYDRKEEKSETERTNERELVEGLLDLTKKSNCNTNQTIGENVHQMAENKETGNLIIKTSDSKNKTKERIWLLKLERDANQEPSSTALLVEPQSIKTEPIQLPDSNSSIDDSSAIYIECNPIILETMGVSHTEIKHTKVGESSKNYYGKAEKSKTKQIDEQKELTLTKKINCYKNETSRENVHQMRENKKREALILQTYYNETLAKKSRARLNSECDANREPSVVASLGKPSRTKTEPIPSSDLNISTESSLSSEIDKNYPRRRANTNEGKLHTVYSLLLDDWNKEKSKTKKIDEQRPPKELKEPKKLNCSKNKTINTDVHQKAEDKKTEITIKKVHSNKTVTKPLDVAKDKKKSIDSSHAVREKKIHHEHPKNVLDSKSKKSGNTTSGLYEFNMFEITYTKQKSVTTLRNDPMKKMEKKNVHQTMNMPRSKETLVKNNNVKETNQTRDILKTKDKHNQKSSTQKRMVNSSKNNEQKKTHSVLKMKEHTMKMRQTASTIVSVKDLNGNKGHEQNDIVNKLPQVKPSKRKMMDEESESQTVTNKMAQVNPSKRKMNDEECKTQTVTNKRRKQNSIFDVVYEPHISMYDRVKARSTKNQKSKKKQSLQSPEDKISPTATAFNYRIDDNT